MSICRYRHSSSRVAEGEGFSMAVTPLDGKETFMCSLKPCLDIDFYYPVCSIPQTAEENCPIVKLANAEISYEEARVDYQFLESQQAL